MNDLLDDDVPEQNIVQYAHDFVTNHPAIKICVKKHKGTGIPAEEKENVARSVHVYVRRLSRLPSCYNRDTKCFSMCTCMKRLDDEIINSLGERIGK